MDRDGRRLLFSPESFYKAEDDLGGRRCFRSVLVRPDSTTAYGHYGLGRPATFSGGRPP